MIRNIIDYMDSDTYWYQVKVVLQILNSTS